MSKGLITAIGLVVSIGVIALGFFLVALPIWVQSIAVDAQTATVADTNAIYQAQVDSLREQEENVDAINAEVDVLRGQIPATGQLDGVFEVIGRAAEATDVTILSVTAGENAAFVLRTSADEESDSAAPAAEATPAPDATTTPDSQSTTEPSDSTSAQSSAGIGRQQVEFAITVTAPNMDRATAFLDALRAGPRLLSSVTATASDNGEGGVALQIAALTYVDAEG